MTAGWHPAGDTVRLTGKQAVDLIRERLHSDR